jgi:hypothetical protein
LSFKPCCARVISLLADDRVLATIDLDNQSPLKAEEIHDIRPDRSLPPELSPIELSEAKTRPKATFRICQPLPQPSGK